MFLTAIPAYDFIAAGIVLYLLLGVLVAMAHCYAYWRWYTWVLFILFWPPIWWAVAEADEEREGRWR